MRPQYAECCLLNCKGSSGRKLKDFVKWHERQRPKVKVPRVYEKCWCCEDPNPDHPGRKCPKKFEKAAERKRSWTKHREEIIAQAKASKEPENPWNRVQVALKAFVPGCTKEEAVKFWNEAKAGGAFQNDAGWFRMQATSSKTTKFQT